MTYVEKWQTLAKRFTFDHSPMPVTIHVRCWQEGDGLELRCCVSSRDHLNGAPLKVWMVEIIPEDAATRMEERDAAWVIAKLVRRGFDHEVREFTRLDGEVFDDPHAEEPTTTPRPQHAEEMHKRASDSLRPRAQEP